MKDLKKMHLAWKEGGGLIEAGRTAPIKPWMQKKKKAEDNV